MTEKELRLWMLNEKAEDAWWVRLDAYLLPESMRLSAIYRLEGLKETSRVELLHISQKENNDPPWVSFDLRSKLDEKGRKRLVRRRRLGRAFQIQIFVLILIASGVGYLLFKPEPQPIAPPQDPVEKVLSTLAQVQANDDGRSEPVLPALKVAVACTERVVYLTNLSTDIWPECEIILNGPDGYRYQLNKPASSQLTLNLPLRLFTKAGEPFPNDEVRPKTVLIRVPGFRDWEEHLR